MRVREDIAAGDARSMWAGETGLAQAESADVEMFESAICIHLSLLRVENSSSFPSRQP